VGRGVVVLNRWLKKADMQHRLPVYLKENLPVRQWKSNQVRDMSGLKSHQVTWNATGQ
jgi:hypothetical protein